MLPDMKRDGVSAYVHMRCDTPSPYTYAFWMTPSFPNSCVSTLLRLKTYKDIRILYSLKYKHSKKISFFRKK